MGDSLLVRELRSGFDKSVLREAGTPELCRRGCHYILTCHCLSTEKLHVIVIPCDFTSSGICMSV